MVWGSRLKFPGLPCLNVGRPNKEIWLPVEVCWISKGQRRMKLDEKQQGEMVKSAAQNPPERLGWIEHCVKDFAKLDQEESVRAFGMDVSQSMVSVRPFTPLAHSCCCAWEAAAPAAPPRS